MTFDLVDFSKYEMDNTYDDTSIDLLYQNLMKNELMKSILDPKSNNLTKKILLQGYDLQNAYVLSFMMLMTMYMQINK